MSAKIFWTILITGGLGGALAAQAQVGSPFAVKKKKQAWEAEAPAPQAPIPQVLKDTPQGIKDRGQSVINAPNQTSNIDSGTYSSSPQNLAPRSWTQGDVSVPNSAPNSAPRYYQAPQTLGSVNPATAPQGAPQSPFAPKTPPRYENTTSNNPVASGQAPFRQNYQGQNYQAQTYQNQAYQNQAYQGQNYPGQNFQGQNFQGQNSNQSLNHANQNRLQSPPKQGWKDKLGFGNIATSLKGFLKLGAAAVRRETDGPDGDEWDDGYIADGQIRAEVSAITQGGLEYGVGGLIRGQYDEFRRGFGGRVGDCPPDIAGCAGVDVAGTPTAIRGHTSRFFTAGPSDERKTDIALEGAYLFLRSSYGDISIGRDDGAAFLFSLGAPGLVAVNASNSPVDYTGLDSVKTVNDASGFAEKITYTSPRLLGDRIGVGIQIGASYSPNARACGVDYCVRRNGADGTGVLAPDLDDVAEFGISLDRNFGNGFSGEVTATYARASEQSDLAVFDDLESFGFGAELKYTDFTLGGSWLSSNNGLENGDYKAWDIGLSWKPAQWGLSLAYGHADDDSVNLTSDQITLGGIYDLNERFSLGAGVQYIDRDTPFVTNNIITEQNEKAYGLFIEGRVNF